jgi:hypothetical protein
MTPGPMSEAFAYRNENGDIILDKALGEKDARHYVKILTSGSEEFRVMQLRAAVATAPPEQQDEHWYAWREPRWGAIAVLDGLNLYRGGTGEETCSSCQGLTVLPEIIWDVCGYYRRLGFDDWREWRHLTTRQLRFRYLALDPANEREDLYYAFCQLRDPVIRKAYDLQPLGGLFFGDRDVRAMIERLAALEAARRNAETLRDDPEGYQPFADQGRVLSEWGLEKGVSEEEARERLRDQFEAESEPLGTAAGALGETLNGWDRWWSFYELADPYDDLPPAPDVAVLEVWQALLCSAFTARGLSTRFSVGFWPGHGPKVWRDSKGSCILFTGTGQPTQRMADEAVEGFIAL